MYFVPDETVLAGFYECEECNYRFLSQQVGPTLICPNCGEQPDMEIGRCGVAYANVCQDIWL